MRRLAPLVLLAAAVPLRADEPRDLVDRAVKAHGGADNLACFNAFRMTFTGNYCAGGPGVRVSGYEVRQGPDRCRFHAAGKSLLNNLDLDAVVADGKGWHQFGGEPTLREEYDPLSMKLVAADFHAQRVRTLKPLQRDPRF